MIVHKNRTAILAAVTCLALLAMVGALVFSPPALAWDNCPRGRINDPYPGACRLYTDTNGDDICDLSQSKPVESTTTTSLVATTTTSGEPPTGDCPLGPCVGCRACGSISVAAVTAPADTGDAVAVGTVALVASAGSFTTSTTTPPSGGSEDSATVAPTADTQATAATNNAPSFLTHYKISPVALGFFLIYAVSFALYKTKRIRISTHRKIWNVLLLATFLITGIFGLILVIQLDYTLPFTIPINLLFWHVEAGIAMTLISLFHMGWHFSYYRNLLRTSRTKARAARAQEGTRRGAAAARELVAQRATAEPERAARAPRPWDDLRP